MKVLVTGGCGYLGCVLVDRLIQEGFKVTVLDNLLFGNTLKEIPSKLHITEGDIRDYSAVKKAVQGIDAVIHLAAIVGDEACNLKPSITRAINYAAVENLVKLGKGRKFIFASTCSVYGINYELLTEEAEVNPVSLYGELKVEAEKLLQENLPESVIFRMGTLYGASPRMRYDLVVNLFIAKAFCREVLFVYGGEQWRPFIHVIDASEAYVKALNNDVRGIFNLGGENYKIIEIAQIMKKHVSPEFKIFRMEDSQDLRDYKVLGEKVERELGFKQSMNIPKAIEEITQSGTFKDYTNPIYSNFKTAYNKFRKGEYR